MRSNVKSILFFLPDSKCFSCHSEAGHPHVSVALVILPGTERLWTICCVKADCTSLSCLKAALTYLTDFSETQGERRFYTKTDSFFLSYFSLCHFWKATKPSICCCLLAITSILSYSRKYFSEIIHRLEKLYIRHLAED